MLPLRKLDLQQHADLEEAISTSRMHDVICVPNKNEKFEEFRNLVDSEIKNAIYSLYGQFSEFTQPIITQTMLRTMENAFRRLLPTQYHCIRSMMGKRLRKNPSETTQEQEVKERQWDRFPFYTFIQQSRLRNSHNFIWLLLVNTASHSLGGRAHIPLHFSYSVAKNTMLRRLNDLFSYSEIAIKLKESLNQFKEFVIAIFNNSQFNIKKKFQRNAHSLNMAKAMCRMFVEPTLPECLNDIPQNWNEYREIPITYIDQIVPSPFEMPPFESLSDDWKFSDLADKTYLSFYGHVDVTGDRVEKYYEIKRVIGYTRRMKRIIPYSSTSFFLYSIPQYTDALSTLCVCEKLKQNWQRTFPSDSVNVHCSFYHHILKLLYKYPEVWQDTLCPAKMLIPPVSPENETTN